MKYYKDKDGNVYAYDDEQISMGYPITPMNAMSPDEVEAHINPPAAVYVPHRVTMRQARLTLHAAGLLGQVETAIDALPEPDRTAAQIEWDYSSVVERHQGIALTIAQALGISDEQLDALFIEAATL